MNLGTASLVADVSVFVPLGGHSLLSDSWLIIGPELEFHSRHVVFKFPVDLLLVRVTAVNITAHITDSERFLRVIVANIVVGGIFDLTLVDCIAVHRKVLTRLL